jgi:hypothetical protein
MKEALRISLIVAAEEAFSNEIKALRQGKKIPRDSTLRNVNSYKDTVLSMLIFPRERNIRSSWLQTIL